MANRSGKPTRFDLRKVERAAKINKLVKISYGRSSDNAFAKMCYRFQAPQSATNVFDAITEEYKQRTAAAGELIGTKGFRRNEQYNFWYTEDAATMSRARILLTEAGYTVTWVESNSER